MTSSTAERSLADPAEVETLASSVTPFIIGVRHHSPAVSVAVPVLLDRFKPDVVLIELPTQLETWLDWLGHPATQAPVALAGSTGDGALSFYPFADFSPELVAVRWARSHGVPVVACDLPLGDPARSEPRSPQAESRFADALQANATGRDGDDLWDRLVEAPAPGCDPEQVRRAALAVGWALRSDEREVSSLDLAREAHMRAVIAEHHRSRCAAIVGSFHASALTGGVVDKRRKPAEITSSLVPYANVLLDARSGYPAGIRDPAWQQAVFEAANDRAEISASLTRLTVEICRAVRAAGFPAGPPEAQEIVRLAEDLASLRGLPSPARGELVEALTTALTHGEVLGRGRVVARAMEAVLVGDRRGRLAPGTPRSGLAPSLEALLADLRLPTPEQPQRQELRLDPLRSSLDTRREVTLQRLVVCGIPYATQAAVTGIAGAAALTTRWIVEWTPNVAALVEVAALRGVTLEQAAAGVLLARRRGEADEGGSTARQVIAGLEQAACCALNDIVATRMDDASTVLAATASLAELLDCLDLLTRLTAGGFAGLSGAGVPDGLVSDLDAAAVRALDGLLGATDVADARSVLALVLRHHAGGISLRLEAALRRLAEGGSPLMRGAASAILVVLELDDAERLGGRVAGWLDLDEAAELTGRLAGVLVIAAPLLELGGGLFEPLTARLESMPDALFLRRLAAIRGGFDVLTPHARSGFLASIEARLDDRLALLLDTDPLLLGRWAEADAIALERLRTQGLRELVSVTPPDRWRLVLGQQRDQLPAGARRMAAALDELYGAGRGEGSRVGLGGATDDAPYPSVREWSEELTALFGNDVREEVLGQASAQGRLDAALVIDPARALPSVELLTSVLSLAGALPEQALAQLRPLVARIVEQLTRQLAQTLTPALTGLGHPRPTRRSGGRLDLARTVRANLHTAVRGTDGVARIAPERPIFVSRAKKTSDWRIVLVVDVSGSMEASTVWSAITAAVFSGVPALTTHLLAFSTEVIDLSGFVSDPLSLLLEISIGGGTSIATGLAAARGLVTVPSRTMVVVVSDFEEGGPIGSLLHEVRLLVDAGVHLLGCASLDETGAPRYSVGVAGELVAAGMPVAALSPLGLARWVAEQVG